MTVGRIAISKLFFSIKLEMNEARQQIASELGTYCVVTEAPKTIFGKVQRRMVFANLWQCANRV